MRKIITILGILLIITVLISGSSVATWRYVIWIDEDNTTNRDNIDGAEDGNFATLGVNTPTETLGWILLDLDRGYEMPPNQDFTVFADSSESEQYSVYVSPSSTGGTYVGSNYDTADHDFTTPSSGSGPTYRYIKLVGLTGYIIGGDPIYGPEIDAVGWDQP